MCFQQHMSRLFAEYSAMNDSLGHPGNRKLLNEPFQEKYQNKYTTA